MCTPGYFLIQSSIRTTGGIQRQIFKRGKRNAISRRYHAKDDKEAIVNWRSDLDGILHVFNVRLVTPARRFLIFHIQTELGINDRATISDTHQDAANKHTTVSDIRNDPSDAKDIVPDIHSEVSNTSPIVSGVRSGIASTPTVVSDIHRNKLKSRDGVDDRNQAVSTTRTLLVTEQLTPTTAQTHARSAVSTTVDPLFNDWV